MAKNKHFADLMALYLAATEGLSIEPLSNIIDSTTSVKRCKCGNVITSSGTSICKECYMKLKNKHRRQ